ncbi:hypothetical protein G7Y89_g709 [Cudoniella acicularis]|uniref:Amine oxidase domain-containing protein n=1 Tax=Cudoniella acicularis TaxID=354080 RepID=A0A8H4RXM1_9HELO|nr:hypothetical protein G7Y89_g709 [Cudoniella acicularis]
MAAPRTSIRAAYAKHTLHQHLLEKLNDVHSDHHNALPAAPAIPDDVKEKGRYQGRICIIGAGAAGLQIAMALKLIGITNVDILEANNRVGGRCYTQQLPDDNDYPHNYYDIGAMRIPDIPWMKPTLDLIDHLGLQTKKVPYIYKNPLAPCSYWYQNQPITDDKFDSFMGPIAAKFTNNFDAAFAEWLTTEKDNYSTRAFLMAGPQSECPGGAPNPYDTATAEIYDTSTGLFDQSLTETVIDYADFQAVGNNPWWRIDGGMQNITDTMQSFLASTSWPVADSVPVTVKTKSPVIALSDDTTTNKISVTVAGQQPVEYDMVFNTTAMAPLQQMNLQGLGLPNNILTGIRSLSYDRATKVAIRFTKPWWKLYGGVSRSDLPISNVVYPSWDDGPDTPAVLMVSYSWAQDATRMGSLVPDYTLVPPSINDPIVALCLQNLVTLWQNQPQKPSLKDLYSMYMTHHAWAWSHDPWTGGAFALFGPGQFKNVYPAFQELLCGDKFAMCGEALSAHHAWISGALDSAYQKVNLFLLSQGRLDDRRKLKESIFGGGEGRDIEEMDEELVKWTVLLGDGGGPKGWGDEYKLRKGKKKGSK